MAKSLYVTTNEAECGKSLVSLGLMELLVRKYKIVGYFRPIISGKLTSEKEKSINFIISHLKTSIKYEDTYAFTKEEAYDLIVSGQYDKLLEKVIFKFKKLQEKCDFVLCEGTSSKGITSSFELDINADIAKNLGSPVLVVASAYEHSPKEVSSTVRMTSDFYLKKGCPLVGTIINRAESKEIDSINSLLKSYIENKDNFYAIIPEKHAIHERKALLLKSFKDCINTDILYQKIALTKSSGTSYKMFEYNLLNKAKAFKKRIVLPEGEDDRVLKAAEILSNRKIVDVIVLGNKKKIQASVIRLGLNLDDIDIIEPTLSPKFNSYIDSLVELRKNKGLTKEKARDLVSNINYFATMMLHCEDADGVVSGAAHTTKDTIKPALQIIKTKPNCSIVSSVFFMCLENRIAVYGDCAINPNPDSEQLAEIAISSADTAKAFGLEPKIAMLSYSSGNSGTGEEVEKVRKATMIAKELRPNLLIEGPIQYDAAVTKSIGSKKMPESKVAGNANVLIFPDLNTGNNTYKAVQRESGAQAIGPMLQGLNRPMNDLSRGCSVLDIVNTVLLTAIQAQD